MLAWMDPHKSEWTGNFSRTIDSRVDEVGRADMSSHKIQTTSMLHVELRKKKMDLQQSPNIHTLTENTTHPGLRQVNTSCFLLLWRS